LTCSPDLMSYAIPMKIITRLTLAVAALIAALCFVHTSHAYVQGPWCAVVSGGGEASVIRDCHYRSIEECRPNVIAGNRGFCSQNPNWPDSNAPARKTRPKRRLLG